MFPTERILFISYDNEMFETKEEKEVNKRRTRLIQILSPFLFFAPDCYLRQIRFLDWNEIDEKPQDWQEFITTLEKPWTDFILYASTISNSSEMISNIASRQQSY